MADTTATASSSKDEDFKAFVSDVERDLLFHIIFNLRRSDISLNEAQRLASDFLALLPEKGKEQLLKKLEALGRGYPEANDVYLKYATPYYETKRHQAIDDMTKHIREGNIEKAIEVGKTAK